MSFILDALKKSESERQQQGSAEFSSVPKSFENRKPSRWMWTLAALLGINLVVLLGIFLRPDSSPEAFTAVEIPRADASVIANSAETEPSFVEQLAEVRKSYPEAGGTSAGIQPQAADVSNSPPVTSPPSSVRTSSRIPTIDELRLNGMLQLAALHVDIHVYSEAADERFVFINMVKHREQSQLADGPTVVEITPDGVILKYNGMTFLLPRE